MNNFLAKFKGILFFHLDGSSLNNLPLMLHDRVYWLLISKSSQLLWEPLFLFRKLLFYGGTLWLGASFLIILRIARSEGDSQNYWYKQKCKRMKCYSPPQSSGQIACVIFNPWNIGAAKHLAVCHARGTRVFSLFIKWHYFKIWEVTVIPWDSFHFIPWCQ